LLSRVGSSGTVQKFCVEKKSRGFSTWYRVSRSRWTLKMSSGYRKCARRDGETSDDGWTTPGKAPIQVRSTGSCSSTA
jgi:hypothetical protein